MPHYFIDILNGHDLVDNEGQDLPDLAAARREAWIGLTDMAHDVMPGKAGLQIRAEIRGVDRQLLAAVSLMMLAEETEAAPEGFS